MNNIFVSGIGLPVPVLEPPKSTPPNPVGPPEYRRLDRIFSKFEQQISMTKYSDNTRHIVSCINICQVPRKAFEHEAVRPSVHSSEGPGKC